MSLMMGAQEEHRVIVILDARVSSEVVNRGAGPKKNSYGAAPITVPPSRARAGTRHDPTSGCSCRTSANVLVMLS